MELNTIFFIGPQGSGKGTQAKVLAKKLDFFYWEMGAILRSLRSQQTTLAQKVTSLIDQGVLLSDDLLLEVVKNKLEDLPADKGVIFDGIPRRIGQAEFLFDELVQQGRKSFLTLFINIPREESLNRLMLRAEKENRPDDTREKIEFRLKQYEQDTVPVLDYLKNRTQYFEIDGTPPVEEVTQKINGILDIGHE